MRVALLLLLVGTASALRGFGMRGDDDDNTEALGGPARNETPAENLTTTASPSTTANSSSSNSSNSSKSIDWDDYYDYYGYGSSSSSSSSSSSGYGYGYGGLDIPDLDPNWTRPWNTENGACKVSKNPLPRHLMEIKSVAGGAYYIGKLGVGTPEQDLNMILDTGSDEIVLKTTECRGCEGYGFDKNSSETYQIDTYGKNDGMDYFEYGSGKVVVQRFNDTVHAGPLRGDGMGMMAITQTDISFFKEKDPDSLHAIVGMAPGTEEYVGNRLASVMNVRRFSECLPFNSNEHGFFIVNDQLPSKRGFEGPFPSVGDYYWAVKVDGFRFEWADGSKEPMPLGKKFVGIVDTGTSLLSLPKKTIDDLEATLDEIDYDCHYLKKLPDLKFEIGGVTHWLPPQAYVALSAGGSSGYMKKQVDSVSEQMKKMPMIERKLHQEIRKNLHNMYFHKKGKRAFVDSQTGDNCMLLFTDPLNQETEDGELAILGMPFFRQYEVSFDFCAREMWTHHSYGDCSHMTGKHPSNKDFCADKDWFTCWAQGFEIFGKGLYEGMKSVFLPAKGDAGGPQAKLNKIQPEHLRMSAVAKWLFKTKAENTKGSLVSI